MPRKPWTLACLVLLLMVTCHSGYALVLDSDWPMWRRDPQNSGYSPVPGNMNRTPDIIWSYFVGGYAGQAYSIDIDGDAADEVVFVSAGKVIAVDASGSVIWETSPLGIAGMYGAADFGMDGSTEILACNPSPSVAFLLDLETGRVVWNYTFPSPASGIGRYGVKLEDIHSGYPGVEMIIWPSKSETGHAFAFPSGAASGEMIWTAVAPETRNFPPAIAVADLDLDGITELVVATYERLYTFNGETGEEGMHCYSPGINRNYGTLVIQDMDDDPYPEIAVLCSNLNEHLWLVDNNGTSLWEIWDLFFEYSYPEDLIEIKVTVDSLSDFNGDGRQEIVYSIFNQSSDARWRTWIIDALTGSAEVEILDEYLLATEDLDGDGRREILTNHQSQRVATYYSNLTIRNLESGLLLVVPNCGVVVDHNVPYPPGTNTIANTEKLLAGPKGYMIRANGSIGWLSLVDGSTSFEPLLDESGFGVGLNIRGVYNGTGLMASGNDGWFRFFDGDGNMLGRAITGGYLAPMVSADVMGDASPEVVVRDSAGWQIVLDVNGTEVSRFQAANRRAKFGTDTLLVIWDMDGDGHNEILAGGTNALLVMDAAGNVSRSYPLPSNPYDWMVANVTGDGHWDLFVTSLGSGPHTAHMFALDGLGGEVLWEKEWGPYAGVVGVGDYDQDGLEDAFVREHFDLYVILSPSGEEKKGTSICGYHAPILTDIESDGMADIVWGGGWGSLPVDKVWYFENQFGTFRYLNKRWVQLFGGGDSDEVYTKMPAVGDVDGDGIKEVAAGNKNGTIHCLDGDKGRLQWNYPVGSNPSDIVSCDIDSDGLDEFIFGTGDGRLVVLGKGGSVEWAMDFGDPVGDVAICDLDRDTKADLLVPVMDGHVYFLHIPELPVLCILWIMGGWLTRLLVWGRSRPFQRTHK